MSALANLASLLVHGTHEGAHAMTPSPRIDVVIAELQTRARAGTSPRMSEDHQLDAVRRFWKTQEVASFRDAYLLSWGLCLPHRPEGECVLDDRPKLERVLAGADDWTKKPTAYRRCYQGLVKSYFSYAPAQTKEMESRHNNWRFLRDYLLERNECIRDTRAAPDWVGTAIENKLLFTSEPYAPYVDALLWGDSSVVDVLCERLHISKASWFLKRLVMAQVKRAVEMDDKDFFGLLPRLLNVLAENEVLRDLGLTRLLDRYVEVPTAPLHAQLQELTVNWWGNPWLPSNATRWGGVSPEARAMVSDWLKSEIIETFFTMLAEDGSADPRRMQFWKRYVKSIDHMEFALGSSARNSTEPDFVALRKKMTGLTCHLETSGANNAFIMKMGNLVVVEFSGMGNALYGYDVRRGVPFDSTKVLRLPTDAKNSLKQKARSVLWESHKDGAGSWSKWEQTFETILHRDFGIEPQKSKAGLREAVRPTGRPTPVPEVTRPAFAMASRPYSTDALRMLSKQFGFEVHDKSSLGGSLWARTDASNEDLTRVLTNWGFSHKPGKGWWK
jgi:hypothetical protein